MDEPLFQCWRWIRQDRRWRPQGGPMAMDKCRREAREALALGARVRVTLAAPPPPIAERT